MVFWIFAFIWVILYKINKVILLLTIYDSMYSASSTYASMVSFTFTTLIVVFLAFRYGEYIRSLPSKIANYSKKSNIQSDSNVLLKIINEYEEEGEATVKSKGSYTVVKYPSGTIIIFDKDGNNVTVDDNIANLIK